MLTAHFANIVGLSLIGIAFLAIFVSPYRHWLGFTIAGMVFWSVVEAFRVGIEYLFTCSTISSYLTAISIALGSLILILLYFDRLSQKSFDGQNIIEHTPVYDSEK